MTLTRLTSRGRRGAAAVVSLSLAAAGLAASAPGAGAVSTSIAYSCTSTSLGGFTLPVVLDTTAPARMAVGQSTQLIVTASATLPADKAQQASATGATQFDGSWVAQATFGTAAASVTQNIPRTQLNSQVVATAAPFTAASGAIGYVAPTTTGVVEVSAGDLNGTLKFYDPGNVAKQTEAITCTLPPGKAPVIDTIAVVASTTTTLTLDRTTSEFGQDVTATAKVTASSGTPDGDVAFAVDGLATKAKVDKDGIATLVLPDAAAGVHGVTATFVPRDLNAALGSSAPASTWTVNRARTRIKVPVTGKTTSVATRVGVKAKGVFDTVPTGKVRIRLTRIGKPGKWAKVRTLDDTGAAKAGFGRLAKGRYQVVVVYRGDTNHLGLRKTRKFRVTRG